MLFISRDERRDKQGIILTSLGSVEKSIIFKIVDGLTSMPSNREYVNRFYCLGSRVWFLFDRRRIYIDVKCGLGDANIIMVYPFSMVIKKDTIDLIDSTGSGIRFAYTVDVTKEEIENYIDSSFRENSINSKMFNHVSCFNKIRCDDPENVMGFFCGDGESKVILNYLDDTEINIPMQWEGVE